MHAKKEVYLNPEQEVSPRACFDAGLYTHKHVIYKNSKWGKEIQKWTQQKDNAKMKRKVGAEQGLIFWAPGRFLSSVPNGVANQEGHFVEFCPE